MDNKKIGSFTGLRFIMIMVIVFSHFYFIEQLPHIKNLYVNNLRNPLMAVDFFFMISGFGMMLSSFAKQKTEELKYPAISDCIKYGINHVKKIYPVYILTILFGFFFQVALGIYKSEFGLSVLLKHIVKLIVNFLILQSATAMTLFIHAFNGVTWFLSALFCIYLISPAVIVFLRKSSKSLITDFLSLVINTFLIIITAYLFEKVEIKLQSMNIAVDDLVYSSPYRRVFYVLVGMNLAMIYQRVKEKFIDISEVKSNLMEICVCLICLGYCLFRNVMAEGLYKYFIDVCLCSLLVFIFAFDKGFISKILNKAIFQKLGNIAMYIFLIHSPITILLGYLVENIFGWNNVSIISFSIFILVSTFSLSILAHKIQNKKA